MTNKREPPAEVFVIHRIAGRAYMNMQDLADKYGMCKRTVRDRVREIENEIGRGKRYERQAVINDGNIVLVNELVFLDWLTVRKDILSGTRRKYVLDFNPGAWARYLGWYETVKEAVS